MRAGYEHKLYEDFEGVSVPDQERGMPVPCNERRQHLPRFGRDITGSGVGERSSSVRAREKPFVHRETVENDVGLYPGKVSQSGQKEEESIERSFHLQT